MAELKATITQPVFKATIKDRGPQGETGADSTVPGPQGEVGETGAQGIQGIQGVQGEVGETGDTGSQGIQGIQGIQGNPGVDGDDGADGADGADAYVYIAYASDASGTGFTLTFNASLDYVAVKHTTSPIASPVVGDFAGLWKNYKGATGSQGIQGIQGIQGEQGIQGDEGPAGAGSGDVLGPATNTDSFIPQWNGANSKTLKNGIPTSTFEPAKGADDNFVTDAEKTVIGNTSGTNTGDNTNFAAPLGADDNYVTDAEKTKIANLSGTNTGDQTLPVKAIGSEVDTGTDDAKFLTPKAIEDSLYVKAAYADAKVADAINDSTTTIAPSQNAVFDALALKLDKAGGTLTGEVDLGENAGLVLDAALSADGKYSGLVEAGTAGATLVFGNLCYLNNDDSRWELVDANLSDGYDKKLGMCVLAAASDGSATKMLLIGKINAASLFPALTVGAPVYMSESAGAIVVAQPTTADVAIRKIGFGNTGDELYFNPSPDYIVHI